MLKYKQFSRIILLLFITAVAGCGQVSAASSKKPATTTSSTSSNNQIQTVAQSYGTAAPLQAGLIVKLDSKNLADVTAATYADSKKMLGVVVTPNETPVSLSSATSGQNVYVVTSGRFNVLVSTQNGSIAAGDYVSISAIDGIGMKADTVEAEVLGRAVNSFDGRSNVISTTNLKMSNGKQLKAAIGRISVDINIAKNPQQANGANGVPQFVQKLALTLVGKPISGPQLYLSVAILIAGIGVVAALLYGGIQTGMTAIGRNPLARKSIMRNLIQVIITGLMIFVGCLIAVYLVLKI